MTSDEAAAKPAEEPAQEPSRQPAKRQKGSLPVWQETLLLLGIAVVLAVVIKAALVQAFYIPSESMEPGLVKNDRILVQKWSYWSGTPERGDVVVFEDPGGWLGADESSRARPTAFTQALAKLGLFPSGRPPGQAGDRRRGRHDHVLRRTGPDLGQRRAARRERATSRRRPASTAPAR